MKKRGKLVLLGMILLAFVAVASKPLWSGGGEKVETPQVVTTQTKAGQTDTNKSEPGQAKASSTDASQNSAVQQQTSAVNTKAPKLTKLLEDSFAKGKPVAVVYTYNADC
ncbi:hypothetical protein [Desulforamulus aeronauticus]|uniref:Uncharacterized protein n=1 Tax=Desulforamulus aeronauticus DSM 10349 TaxID=1121421 RepID=A0A1M6UZW0_9FIRM|nr:hypothetical protein [Desulforamulus aeronauticus]SHK72989.1 hypothetical protein SAMN02745123_02918 [Desulforamulus aeronauticus DSM 10349]SHK74743.1 hypothetical protein SAMN02745123_03008 [Desulforamulus aeronauticus DSM 10349]